MQHPRDFWGLLIYIVHVSNFFPVVKAYDYKQVTFYMQNDRGLPQGLQPVSTIQTLTVIECTRECKRHPYCFSFHAEKNNNFWTCNLLDNRYTKVDIPLGTGRFGIYFGYTSTDDTHPTIPGAQFLFETNLVYEEASAAVYDCRQTNPVMGMVGIIYDNNIGDWPSLDPTCAQTLCNELGLSGTNLNLDQPIVTGVQTAKTVCTGSDRHFSDVSCDINTGKWDYQYDPNVACVSTKCVRYNRGGRAVYGGEINETKSGIACQNWNTQQPNSHYWDNNDFDEDYADINEANNFCRDLDNSGTPWCFQTSRSEWDVCDVPLCLWPFDI